MRLTQEQTRQIAQIICRYTDTGGEAAIFLFGSRLDDSVRESACLAHQAVARSKSCSTPHRHRLGHRAPIEFIYNGPPLAG